MDLPDRPEAGWSRSTLVVTFYGGLTLAALVWRAAAIGDINIFRFPGVVPKLPTLSLVAGALGGLGVVGLSRLAERRFAWARGLQRDFRELLGPLTAREILLLALASSVGEECFFRGAMQVQIGLVAASAVFSLLHVGPGWRFLPWTISAFAVGCGMGAAYRVFGDLGAPIAAHFTINYLNLRHITGNSRT